MRYAAPGAIVALVIVISFKDKVWWVAPQTYPDFTVTTPNGTAAGRQAASGYALRGLPPSE